MIFAPSLGLFDCLHHGRLAALPVNDNEMIFEYTHDGVPLNFSNGWEPLKINDISNFPDIPVVFVLAILITMILFHVFASSLIQKQTQQKQFSADLLLQGLYSFISPPLHLDWELFHRQNTENYSVLKCWKRYRN